MERPWGPRDAGRERGSSGTRGGGLTAVRCRARSPAVGASADVRLRAARSPPSVAAAERAHVRVPGEGSGSRRWCLRAMPGMLTPRMRGHGPLVRGVRPRGGGGSSSRVPRVGAGRRRAGGPDPLQRLPRRGLHHVGCHAALRPRRRGLRGCPGRERSGRPLDGHTAGEGRDGHGDQERRTRRRSLHPRNSAGFGGLWGADGRRMPRTGDLTPRWPRRSVRGSDRRARCDGRTPRSCGCISSAG